MTLLEYVSIVEIMPFGNCVFNGTNWDAGAVASQIRTISVIMRQAIYNPDSLLSGCS